MDKYIHSIIEGDGEVEPRPPDPVQGYIEEAEILVTYLSRYYIYNIYPLLQGYTFS